MDQSNMIAQEVEKQGVRTFSAKEMAFNILGLMHPILFSITQVEPVWGDLSGGFDRIADLADMTSKIRINLNQKAELRRSIARDNAAEFKVINGAEAERVLQTVNITPRANFRFEFPELPEAQSLESFSQLRDVIDLDKVIVIAGFGEVGPWGSSRTRWEMEAKGRLTLEGCIEMAWMMGYIKHFDGRLKDGTVHVGWVDAKTGEPVDDKDVRGRYEKEIMNHAGVRFFGKRLYVLVHSFADGITQSPSFSAGTTPSTKCSTQRLSSFTILSLWRSQIRTPRNSRRSMATSATSGRVMVASGSLS
jgi:fatty acid synthase subunit alpha